MTDNLPSTALIMQPDMIGYIDPVTYEQAARDFEAVRAIGVKSKLVLGYLIGHIQREFGEDAYLQLVSRSQYEPGYLKNVRWVFDNIYPENRSFPVSWSHLYIAASISSREEQAYWLQRCVDEDLSRKEFHQLLHPQPIAPPEESNYWMPLNDRSALQFVLAWLSGRVAGHDKKRVKEILEAYLETDDAQDTIIYD